ncbi:MAG: tRNA pseudouridine(38-40) synthase TruA [Synergistaceae bacterium]|jgi:tRNA pseudouridine38-40 synthase|nr:tRNA pseudouridine(38-40) synthase TruA [Synergistaceae bacterium]
MIEKNLKYAAQVAYVGTGYSGWQRQPEAVGVQQVLEEALRRVSSKPVSVVGAGRTDGGVHAVGQVASFEMDREWEPDRLMMAVNFYLPPDVSLMRVERAPGDFHARRSALWREYRYFVWHGRSCWPHLRGFVWWRKRPWDGEKVRAACRMLEGNHDFRAFCKTGECPENSVRTLSRVRYKRMGDLSLIVTRAPSFLMNMVRIMVGNIDSIGRGEEPLSWLEALLGGTGRDASAMTAPAGGLYFWRVAYREFTFAGNGGSCSPIGGEPAKKEPYESPSFFIRRSRECSERILG